MTVWIDPRCPAEIEAQIRADAAARGEDVMPRRTFPWNRLASDQKTVAERKWKSRNLAPKPQLPCDVGLFGDETLQSDLIEMLTYSHEE